MIFYFTGKTINLLWGHSPFYIQFNFFENIDPCHSAEPSQIIYNCQELHLSCWVRFETLLMEFLSLARETIIWHLAKNYYKFKNLRAKTSPDIKFSFETKVGVDWSGSSYKVCYIKLIQVQEKLFRMSHKLNTLFWQFFCCSRVNPTNWFTFCQFWKSVFVTILYCTPCTCTFTITISFCAQCYSTIDRIMSQGIL